jgi:hypothetical protein
MHCRTGTYKFYHTTRRETKYSFSLFHWCCPCWFYCNLKLPFHISRIHYNACIHVHYYLDDTNMIWVNPAVPCTTRINAARPPWNACGAVLVIYWARVQPSSLFLRPFTVLLYLPCMIVNDYCRVTEVLGRNQPHTALSAINPTCFNPTYSRAAAVKISN